MGGASDFVVIGGGIAGASAAWALQAFGRTTLLEREHLPGQHTTGRSAAFLVGSYGTPVVQRLTRASRAFLESPPDGFAPHPLVHACPSIAIARRDQRQRLADDTKLAREAGAHLVEVEPAEVERRFPVLRPGYLAAAVEEPASKSIDVAALLEAFVRGFRARGGVVRRDADVTAIRREGRGWEVRFGDERLAAGVVVNAAGAWGERIGALARARPVGLRPLRRTAVSFDAPPGADVRGWPCLIDADEEFYVKPQGVKLLASPCDEEPSEPCDPSPDDLGIALAMDRVNRATSLALTRVERSWAGLRTFAPDRQPVIGMDAALPGFFWLVGQGGFGIMTSPAAARACASLVVDGVLPRDLLAAGLREDDLSPERESLPRG